MPETPAVIVQPKPRQKPTGKPHVNYALAGTLLAQGFSYDEIAPQVGAATGNSLRSALSRKGVTLSKIRKLNVTPEVENQREQTSVARVSRQASEIVRQVCGDVALSHVSALSRIKAKANVKAIRAIGEALEPLVRSASRVFGWESAKPSTTINVLQLSDWVRTGLPDAGPVVDIEPEPSPACVPPSVSSDKA